MQKELLSERYTVLIQIQISLCIFGFILNIDIQLENICSKVKVLFSPLISI